MPYATMNPVPSTDPRDLYDNAGITDKYVNGQDPFVPDRLGLQRRTWKGMEVDFNNAQEGRQTTFDQFLESSSFVWIGDYGAGLTFTSRSQYMVRDGQAYRLATTTTLPYTTTGNWALEQTKFSLVNSDAVLRQELIAPSGASKVGYGEVTVKDALDDLSGGPIILKALTDGTDQTAIVESFFAMAFSESRPWMVPPGDYTINPSAPIYIKTSGVCHGRFLVPKANQTFRFETDRDEPGTVISTAGWVSLRRGVRAANALNAVGKNLFISSTEVLMERIGSGGSPYLKQEFIRCPMPGGVFNTSIVRDYNSNSSLTVTAHTPSKLIRIHKLEVVLTGPSGGVESNRGLIVNHRDNIIFDYPQVINLNPAQPKPVAFENTYCGDAVFNQPHAVGFNYDGLGYGIINGTSIGLTVNQPRFEDCRHGYTAAFDVDVTINGGHCGRVVDSHWTDRMKVNGVTVDATPGSSAFLIAGDDAEFNNCVQFGGRNMVGIRTDTPSLGGKIVIKNPTIRSRGETGDFHLFGFSSPSGPGPIDVTYTNKPRLPDLVIMEDGTVDTDTPNIHGAFLGTLLAPHTTWGEVCLRGEWDFPSSNNIVGIFAEKNSIYQQDRRTLLVNAARMDCGASGTAIYVTAFDGVTTGAMDVRVENVIRGNLRYSGYSVNILRVSGCGIGSIDNDNTAATSIGMSAFSNVHMLGGAVAPTLKNMSFQGCQFTGNYSAFPLIANVTMVGNIKSSSVTGLPADIRANVVAPYS